MREADIVLTEGIFNKGTKAVSLRVWTKWSQIAKPEDAKEENRHKYNYLGDQHTTGISVLQIKETMRTPRLLIIYKV